MRLTGIAENELGIRCNNTRHQKGFIYKKTRECLQEYMLLNNLMFTITESSTAADGDISPTMICYLCKNGSIYL